MFFNGVITSNKVADNIDREIVSDKSKKCVCVCWNLFVIYLSSFPPEILLFQYMLFIFVESRVGI